MSACFVDKNGCSQHTNFPGVDIFTTAGKHMLMSLVEFQPGAIVEAHSHPHEQMGVVLWSRKDRLDSLWGTWKRSWGQGTCT